MKNAFLFFLLLSITLEQGPNSGYYPQGNNPNIQPNQNAQYDPQQYGSMGQSGNNPQNNPYGQNQQYGNQIQNQYGQNPQ